MRRYSPGEKRKNSRSRDTEVLTRRCPSPCGRKKSGPKTDTSHPVTGNDGQHNLNRGDEPMFRKRQWSGDEFMILVQRYPSEGPQLLAAELGRTLDSVDSQAARLRLRSLTRRARQSKTLRLRKGQRVLRNVLERETCLPAHNNVGKPQNSTGT